MKFLLVSATKFEINPLFKKLKKVSDTDSLSCGRFGKHSVDVLITGLGMTATAFHLGKCLYKKYDLAINAGVAGSFNKNIPMGTVVNVVSDCFGDLGAEDGERFLTLEEMGMKEIRGSKPPAPSRKFQVTRLNSLFSLKKVNGITVNTVHGNTASIKKVIRKFKPDIESMEGAAFFFACKEFKTPCLQIRAVSNYVERRNKKKWEIDLAIKNLNLFIGEFLKA